MLIKFRSDTLDRTILFLGYSLSDINLRYLLYKLTKLWEASEYAAARPRSYIVLPRPNPERSPPVLWRVRGFPLQCATWRFRTSPQAVFGGSPT